jgi:hypothetical protein
MKLTQVAVIGSHITRVLLLRTLVTLQASLQAAVIGKFVEPHFLVEYWPQRAVLLEVSPGY